MRPRARPAANSDGSLKSAAAPGADARIMRRCRAFPMSSSAGRTAARPLAALSSSADGACARTRSNSRLRHRRPPHPRHRRVLPRLWRDRRSAPGRSSHVPLLIGEDEWRAIARGVEQRVRLLDAMLADIYGDGRLVAEGVAAGRGDDRQPRLSAAAARREAAGRTLPAALRRRPRPRARRALVGAGAIAPRRRRARLCAGEPARPFAGVSGVCTAA